MPLKADNTNSHPEIEALLEELGNTVGGLPYYALFIPGQDEPKHFDGVFGSSASFLTTLNDGVEIPKAKVPDATGPEKTVIGSTQNTSPAETANRL